MEINDKEKGEIQHYATRNDGNVSEFYNKIGWKTIGSITEDARRWEDLREFAQDYVKKCRLRVLRHIPPKGDYILDMGSGPIQYPEYLEYSVNYKRRYCVDFSLEAIESAKKKIGEHGVFLQGNFEDIKLDKKFFDCSISLHTIYHIDEDVQENVVRKLLYVTKPGKPVIIVYSNPNTIIHYVKFPLHILRRLINYNQGVKNDIRKQELYFYAHPLGWWDRFRGVADVMILPWRSFSAKQQKCLVHGNRIGKALLNKLFDMEDRFPNFFVRYFQYPMIILRKVKAD